MPERGSRLESLRDEATTLHGQLRGLQRQQDQLMAEAQALGGRLAFELSALGRAPRRQQPEAEPEAIGQLRKDIAVLERRLAASERERTALGARWEAAARLVRRAEAAAVRFVMAWPAPLPPVRIIPIAEARTQIGALTEEAGRVRASWLPLPAALRNAEAAVPKPSGPTFNVTAFLTGTSWPRLSLLQPAQDALAVLATIDRAAVLAVVERDVKAAHAAKPAHVLTLSEAERGKRLKQIEAELLELEVAEEAAIRAAERRGEHIDRRPDCRLEIVLAPEPELEVAA